MTTGFVNLHVSSSHSTHWGASSPADIVEAAMQFNQQAIAITDRDSLAGVVPFTKAAKDAGVKPIIGCELTNPKNIQQSVALLARSRKGYELISKTITERHLDESFDFITSLTTLDDSIIILIPDPEILSTLVNQRNAYAGNATVPVASRTAAFQAAAC